MKIFDSILGETPWQLAGALRTQQILLSQRLTSLQHDLLIAAIERAKNYVPLREAKAGGRVHDLVDVLLCHKAHGNEGENHLT